LHHELWRDELQSWLVARDSHSLIELYRNCRFEGHPILWYFLLYLLTAVTHSLLALQLLNLFLGTAFIFLFNRFSGLGNLQKILFSFGYYAVFEFTLISRSYNLELLLIALVLVLFRERARNLLWISVVLVALANVSAFGLLFAVCLGAVVILDEQYRISGTERGPAATIYRLPALVICIAGMLFSVLQIRPEEGNLVSTDSSSLADMDRISVVFSRIYDAYLLVPEWKVMPYWNFAGTMRLDSYDLFTELFFSVLILVACLVILWRKPVALLFFVVVSAGVFVLCEVPFLIALRYTGRFFLAFMFALWLGHFFPDRRFSSWGNAIAAAGKKIQPVFLYLVLGVQLLAGAKYFLTDLRMPFSSSGQVASLIKRDKLDSLPVVGTQDYAASCFAALLDKQVFYPESKTWGSFITWDNHLRTHQNPDFDVVIQSVDSVLNTNYRQALVILNTLPAGPNGKLEHDLVTPTIKMDMLFQSEKCMVPDEYYYVFLATRIQNR
jgi:hypothetical protein